MTIPDNDCTCLDASQCTCWMHAWEVVWSSATYVKWDNSVTFTAEEISTLNRIFWDLDLQSNQDKESLKESDISKPDLNWLMWKFGADKKD